MHDFIQQFFRHDSGPVVQFLKYAIAGGVATAVHIVLFHIAAWKAFPALKANDTFVKLLKLEVPEVSDSRRSRNSMISNLIAFLFSNMTAYVLNIYWVFQPGRHSWYVEVGMFYAVSGFSIFLGTSVMGYLIAKRHVRTTYAFCSNLVTALIFNFALRKFVIFKG